MPRRVVIPVIAAWVLIGSVDPLAAQARIFRSNENPTVEDLNRALGPDILPVPSAPVKAAPPTEPAPRATRGILPRTQRADPVPAPAPAPETPAPVVEAPAPKPPAAPPPKPEVVCAKASGSSLAIQIQFELNSAKIDAAGAERLRTLAEALKLPNVGGCKFEISGHTDARGSDSLNLALSEKRAAAVRAFLGDLGIDLVRLTPVGKGRTALRNTGNPFADENRRVEFKVL